MNIRLNLTAALVGFVVVVSSSAADTRAEIAQLFPQDPAPQDAFGISVAMDGPLVVVGAFGDDDQGDRSGSAYVFDLTTGAQIAKLLPADGAAKDFFGFSVAISGTTVLVGTPIHTHGQTRGGGAYLFDALTGAQIAELRPTSPRNGDGFGEAVALDGQLAAVGAPGTSSVYLFDSATGLQTGKLGAGGFHNTHGGKAVSVVGDKVLAGTPDPELGSPLSTGEAFLFRASSGLLLSQFMPLRFGKDLDHFGAAVGISDQALAIGAWGDDEVGIHAGAVYVFDGTSNAFRWKFNSPSTTGGGMDHFGSSVSVTGDLMACGAPGHDGSGMDTGVAYLFDVRTGVCYATLLPTRLQAGDQFGSTVAISGNLAIGGVPDDATNGVRAGTVYVFDATYHVPAAGASIRNGTGVNAVRLNPVTAPALGSDWITDIDPSGHQAGFVAFEVYALPSSGRIFASGELLVDLTSTRYLEVLVPHFGNPQRVSIPVPADAALYGISASAQGIVFGLPGPELTNAVDVVLGY